MIGAVALFIHQACEVVEQRLEEDKADAAAGSGMGDHDRPDWGVRTQNQVIQAAARKPSPLAPFPAFGQPNVDRMRVNGELCDSTCRGSRFRDRFGLAATIFPLVCAVHCAWRVV